MGGTACSPKFCHFDLLADNFVMRGTGEILLVDFEYAAPGQPLMDLAVLAMGCSLEPVEERNLLSSYLGVEVTDSQVYSFKAVKLIAALRETLWGTTAELSESSALSLEEAKAYVDMNFAKFQELCKDFENSRIPSAPAPDGAVEMKVSTKRSSDFYVRSARSFLKGIEAKPAEEGREAVEAKAPVNALRISGLGESIKAAILAATSAEADGLGTITRIQTAHPVLRSSGRSSACAQILIDVKRNR